MATKRKSLTELRLLWQTKERHHPSNEATFSKMEATKTRVREEVKAEEVLLKVGGATEPVAGGGAEPTFASAVERTLLVVPEESGEFRERKESFL